MSKTAGTEDPRSPKVTLKLMDDLRSILREYPRGEQKPPLQLALDFLKEELGKAGHERILGDRIGLAFQTLHQQRLITLQEPVRMGGWTIASISPDI